MISQKIKKCFHIIGMIMISSFLYVQTIYAQDKWFKTGSEPEKYSMHVDSSMQHDHENVMTINSINENIQGFGTYMQNSKPEQYLGKRVRMTGFMKTKDVANYSAFWFRVDQAGSQQYLSFDNMYGRGITKTTDWKKYEIVLDVPNNASNIAYGAMLVGTGQIWFANVKFEVVDNSVPSTARAMQD